jgi:hypothetical protein
MYLWLLIAASAGKQLLHPEHQQDVLSIGIPFLLGIALFLMILAFLLGAVISWRLLRRRKQVDTTFATPARPSAGWSQRRGAPPLVERSFEQRKNFQEPEALIFPPSPSANGGPTAHSRNYPGSPASSGAGREEKPQYDERWLHLAEECADLFDELDRLAPNVDAPRQEMIRHVKHRLQEILTRSGVELIDQDTAYDRSRHKLEPLDADIPSGTPLVEIVSPGFVVGRRVLRPAHVRVATTPHKA